MLVLGNHFACKAFVGAGRCSRQASSGNARAHGADTIQGTVAQALPQCPPLKNRPSFALGEVVYSSVPSSESPFLTPDRGLETDGIKQKSSTISFFFQYEWNIDIRGGEYSSIDDEEMTNDLDSQHKLALGTSATTNTTATTTQNRNANRNRA